MMYLTQGFELLFKLGAGRTERLGNHRQRRNHTLCVRVFEVNVRVQEKMCIKTCGPEIKSVVMNQLNISRGEFLAM